MNIADNLFISTQIIMYVVFILFLLKYSIRFFVDIIDSSKYCLAFSVYYFRLSKEEISKDKELLKRYINPNDYIVIEKTKEILHKLTDKVEFVETTYSELKHPFFVWYGKIFCKSDGNEVIDIKDGNVGKISPQEKVKSCVLYDNFEYFLKYVEFAKELEKKLKEAQYIS